MQSGVCAGVQLDAQTMGLLLKQAADVRCGMMVAELVLQKDRRGSGCHQGYVCDLCCETLYRGG